jgi:hypothetical protein
MLDSILYTARSSPGPLIDAGALAESLIFYGKVKVVGNTGILKGLTRCIPPFELLELLRSGRLEIYYLGDQIGVSSREIRNGTELHDLVRISSPNHTIETIAAKTFQEAAGRTSSAILGAKEFESLIQEFDHSDFDQASIVEMLTNKARINETAKAVLQSVAPQYKEAYPINFGIEKTDQGLEVDTDIDFAKVNQEYHKLVPPEHSSISQAHIISAIQSAYEKAFFAGSLDSEIAVAETEQAVFSKTISEVIGQRNANSEQVQQFIGLILGNGRAIREAVNSGEVRFSSILKLLDNSDRFRGWIADQPADASLLTAFYDEITKDSWVDKLPPKTIRFSIFTALGYTIDVVGAGGLGTLASLGVNAVDSFLVDRLIKGWKPHQFVNKSLKPLFSGNTARKISKGFGP